MKRILCVAFAFLLLQVSAQAQEVILESQSDDAITLTVIEHDVKKKEAVERAVYDALFAVLFRGIPGAGDYSNAMLGTDESQSSKHREYFDNMKKNGRIYSFLTFKTLEEYKKKTATVKMAINMKALRSDMERNNIYRRFGFY